MKPLEILSALPDWSKATPDQLLASPAWTLPCRLGDTPCGLRLDAPRPADQSPAILARALADRTPASQVSALRTPTSASRTTPVDETA